MFPGQTPEQDAQARALAANMDAAQAAVDALGSNPDPVTQGKAIAALNHARYLMAQFLSDTPPPPPQPDGPSMRAWTEDDQANAERVERLKAAYEYWGGALAPLGIEVPNPYAPPEGFDPSRAHDLEQEGPPPMNPY
jgi:hypothetical protein